MVRVSDEELEDPNRFDEVIAYGDLFHDLRDARALLRDAAEALQECRVAARVGDYQHRIERIDATTKPIIARIEGGAS